MNLRDFVKQAPALYEAGTAVHLIGPPGIGKTQITSTVRDALSARYSEEFGYQSELLTIRDAPDIGGFLLPAKYADGTPYAFYTRSPLLPSKEYLAAHPRGVYVLDERNQADLLVQKAAAPIILDRRFGNDYLPKGWWVISCSNRIEDRSGVVRAPAFVVNREVTIPIEADVGSWAAWAEAQGIHPFYIAFARTRPGVVFSNEVPKHDGPFCTARSYSAAAKLHALMAGNDGNGEASMDLPLEGIVSPLIAGHVGDSACAELFAYLKLKEQLPQIEEIEKDPSGAKCPERLDAAYAALQMCVHFAKAGNIDKLWTYVERLPKELQVSAAKSLIEKAGGLLINSKALTAWMGQNRALINASAI